MCKSPIFVVYFDILYTMLKKHSIILLFFLILGLTDNSKAQTIGVGGSGIYNFQTESFGYGARLYYGFNSHWAIVPQWAHYPAFNKINEYYLGATVQYNFLFGRTSFYLLLGGAYNRWSNYKDYHNKLAQLNNFAEEGGIGAMFSWKYCLNPFAEIRYNLNWKESNAQVGILYFFKGCKSKGKSRRRGGGKSSYCPAYF